MSHLPKSFFVLLMALFAGLFLSEFLTRIFYPRYQYAAAQAFQYEKNRLVARVPEQRLIFTHPDENREVIVQYNRFGLRGSELNLNSSNSLWGFFGDSFVENVRLDQMDVFTERLSLNSEITALNFGVEGYGTDQSWLFYRHFLESKKLKKIFYLFCHNDILDIENNQLFQLDGNGELVSLLNQDINYLKKWLGQWHLSYLFLEVYHRLQGRSLQRFQGENPEMQMVTLFGEKSFQKRFERMGKGDWRAYSKESRQIFETILNAWSTEVQSQGAEFIVLILPDSYSHELALSLGLEKRSDTEFLRPVFLEHFQSDSEWTFETDYHWNEEANHFLADWLLESFSKIQD